MKKFIWDIFVLIACALLLTLGYFGYQHIKYKPPIKVGVLHSLTGNMAISENAVMQATVMAIDEINEKGGLLGGRRIEPVIIDIRSDWDYASRMAKKLIQEDKVSVVFGCWTSACRKTVKPVFEESNHLLFYPIQYEGLEESPNIVYTGATPNQQIIPAVKWAFDHIGKKVFLVGSDYVFPKTANTLIRNKLEGLGGEVVGEEYVILGSDDVGAIIDKIIEAKPDVILNTINGSSNLAFFQKLREKGVTSDKIPTISFSIGEGELQQMDPANVKGDYAVWNYFQTINTDINKNFVRSFKKKYGENSVVGDPMEAAYFGVYLWSQAVEDADSDDVYRVKQQIKKQSLQAPEGLVYIDPETQHTWKIVRIGKIRDDGQFDIIWNSKKPVRPIPYPIYKTVVDWNIFLNKLYKNYGNSWSKQPENQKMDESQDKQNPNEKLDK
jgi:urea transport system substrate-binding protein